MVQIYVKKLLEISVMSLFLLKITDAKIMTEEKTDKFRNSTNMMKSDLN